MAGSSAGYALRLFIIITCQVAVVNTIQDQINLKKGLEHYLIRRKRQTTDQKLTLNKS